MIEYQKRIIEERIPTYIAEEYFENKKVVVKGFPETREVYVEFYRDNELLTNNSEFNWMDKKLIEFEKIRYNSYGEFLTEQYIIGLANKFKKFLKLIKDPILSNIELVCELKL